MADRTQEMRSLALTPTWSVATVLTIFVVVSLIVERLIHCLSNWLRRTNRKPLLAAVEKMKEELMLLGFISLLLTATSSIIANICIPTKFYDSNFTPCTRSEIYEQIEGNDSGGHKLLVLPALRLPFRRMLSNLEQNTIEKGHEPFVSYQGLEQLHRFIFVMAVTHISYSCLTMLLAIVKTCFFRQFGRSVVRSVYITLRKGFIMNHHLSLKYDFHSYMIRSMEEEFQRIVGVSGLLWAFVVAFMLFNVKGSNLYFWIAIIPIMLVLMVGAKLQHVIVTLALENAGINGCYAGGKLKPRDELFWFRKPELLLSLIHFILFQWQFGYSSCFIRNHLLVYIRLILGFAGQFPCSYSTLPLYALATSGCLNSTKNKETMHGWGKAARRKRRHGFYPDDSTIHTDTSTVMSLEDDENHLVDGPEEAIVAGPEIELQPASTGHSPAANENSNRVGIPLLQTSSSVSLHVTSDFYMGGIHRSTTVPPRRQ